MSIHLAACHLVRYMTAAVINAFGIFRITTYLPLLKKKVLVPCLASQPFSLHLYIKGLQNVHPKQAVHG